MPPAAPLFDEMTSSSFNKNDLYFLEPKKVVERPMLKRAKPRVVFHERVKIVQFEKLNEYTRGLIWYCKDEYDIIRARNSLIVKMTKSGSMVESDEHSFRGLEHKLKEGYIVRRDNKLRAVSAVMTEQERQREAGLRDLEMLAESSRRVTQPARERAFRMGLEDYKESSAYSPQPFQDDSSESTFAHTKDCDRVYDCPSIASDSSSTSSDELRTPPLVKLLHSHARRRALFRGSKNLTAC
jgi:hypothetical protein